MAVAWAKKIGTPYVEDPVFQANFLSDFLKLFPEKFKDVKIADIVFPTLPEKVELTVVVKSSWLSKILISSMSEFIPVEEVKAVPVAAPSV